MSHPVQTVDYFSEWLQFHWSNLAKLPLNTNSDFVQLADESEHSVIELRQTKRRLPRPDFLEIR